MTVIIEKPAINLREELADLRNQGTYQEQQFYFDGLVTNGTFDTDLSGWDVVSRFTYSNGTALKDSAGTGDGNSGGISEFITFLPSFYKVQWDIVNWSSGTVSAAIRRTGQPIQASQRTAFYSGNGTFSEVLRAQSTIYTDDTFNISTSTNANLSIDNISLYESDANGNVLHRMPKGWVPKDVFEDGLLQREGAAHDYEVVYDGFDYYVKPAVAPSVTTTTCVIGVRK